MMAADSFRELFGHEQNAQRSREAFTLAANPPAFIENELFTWYGAGTAS